MDKKYRISPVVFLVFIIAIGFITSCKSGKKPPQEDQEVKIPENVAEIKQDIDKATKIFNALPSPLESAMLIKSAGAQFDGKLLNPVSRQDSYQTRTAQALNLGIYTCDLSFASLYEQTQLLIDYMNAAKKMADGLGILDAIKEEDINKLEENINNSEVIMDVVSQTFMNSNTYLEDNGQPATAAIVLVGGWIEGLYISTQLVDMKEFNGNKLVAKIIDQKLSIDILIDLLNSSKGNPSIDGLLPQVQKLKTVFDKIKLTTSAVRPEYDAASNTTILKSEVKTDMTQDIFIELSKTVAEIRNSFVK
jgi:hypothetical protein